LSNRFEKRRGGFLDMAISVCKKAKTFWDDVERVIDWRPREVSEEEAQAGPGRGGLPGLSGAFHVYS